MDDNKKTVLVVDDEADFLKVIKFRLEANGYDVVTAATGKDALDKVRTCRLDAVLLDVLLPDMSGIDVLREIRKLQKDLPVFIITAFSNKERFELANKFSASGFIVKSGDLQKEIEHITGAIRISDKYKG
ncbi:MAG: response regulator [Candidatus Omnitrophica bacterium]|nr:response regulator [Candidatus Omnitrophota bacterium]